MIPPSLAVIVLGLTSSIVWGISDFIGGITSRRAPLLGVLLVSQVIGLAIAFPVALARSEPGLVASDVGWSVVSGILGAVGIGCLYRGLAVGRMGVVAPITGVLVAVIPSVAGIVLGGLPSPAVVVGIALAIVSVALVARVPGESITAERPDDVVRPSGLAWGLASGLLLGAFTVTFSRVTEGLVFGPLALMKAVEGIAFLAAILIGRQAWRVPRRLWPAVLVIGILDMGATATYLAATQAGPLEVAGVLSGLYPVVTVILAAIVIRERVTGIHAVGIVGAGVAIALIASGS